MFSKYEIRRENLSWLREEGLVCVHWLPTPLSSTNTSSEMICKQLNIQTLWIIVTSESFQTSTTRSNIRSVYYQLSAKSDILVLIIDSTRNIRSAQRLCRWTTQCILRLSRIMKFIDWSLIAVFSANWTNGFSVEKGVTKNSGLRGRPLRVMALGDIPPRPYNFTLLVYSSVHHFRDVAIY